MHLLVHCGWDRWARNGAAVNRAFSPFYQGVLSRGRGKPVRSHQVGRHESDIDPRPEPPTWLDAQAGTDLERIDGPNLVDAVHLLPRKDVEVTEALSLAL